MHIPDGFISGATALGAGAAAAGGLGVGLHRAGAYLQDRRVPLAGLTAAFIFVLQLINFPVAAGTSGHLLGGALAGVLVGPWLGIVAVSVVVIVQALLFADGGLTALGLNVLNLAVITTLIGWAAFRLVTGLLPRNRSATVAGSFVAGLLSVVAASAGFAIEYALGGSGDVAVGAVATAVIGVHVLIGIGEGLITASIIGAVVAIRPDLVEGARRLGAVTPKKLAARWFGAAAVVLGLVLALLVAPLASPEPDGLERVARDTGLALEAEPTRAAASPLAGYKVDAVDSEAAGTGLSGVIGATVTFGVGIAVFALWPRRRRGR